MKIIIWAEDPNLAVPLRQTLREDGHGVMIRSSNEFRSSSDVEACEALAFIGEANRAFILAEYRSPTSVQRFGDVKVYDIETGNFGEPIGLPPIASAKVEPEPSERDLLTARLENLADKDLRIFAQGVLGRDIDAETSREDIEAMLRQGEAGAGKPDPAGVAIVTESAPDQTAPAETGSRNEAGPPAGGRGGRTKAKPAE